MKKSIIFLLAGIMCLIFTLSAAAHSGRTDSKGGHYDHSTGDYHYHHGYPPHDHYGGECPYKTDNKTEINTSKENYNNTTNEKEQSGFVKFFKSVFLGILGGGIFGAICWSAVMVVYLAFNRDDEKSDKFFSISAWIIIPLFMIGFFIYSISN